MADPDMALVRDFVQNGSERAFTALVERHGPLVYSAALRQVRDPHLAQEVAQTVFILLARKAPALGEKTILAGWLYRTARYAASDALKILRRRAAREQEACMNSPTVTPDPTASAWTAISPLLDEAMASLGDRDRTALVLRFFNEASIRRVAEVLEVEESAAQKRVARALEKLRALLVKRGVMFPAALLAATVSANAVQTAPAGLVSAVSQAAAGTAVSATTLGLVKATVTSIGSPNTTLAALLTLAAGALSSSGIVASHFEFSGAPNGWMNPSAYLLLSLALGLGLPALLIGLALALPRIPSPASTQRQRLPGHREVLFDRLSRLLIGLACLDVAFQVLLQLLVFQANRQNPPHLSTPLAAGLAAAYLTLTTAWILAMCRHFQLRPKTAPARVPRGTEAPATLDEIEWRNPENWAGPAWRSIYHGRHDSRVWVPKQIPALGWTINFGHPAGRSWLIGLVAGLALALAVGTAVFLSVVY